MKNNIDISVVIPVKNGITTLSNCIESIREQTVYDKTEIILIDSGSSDGTLGMIAAYPEVKLYQITPESFNHGATRNYGVSLARGEFVVMTVQDAAATDEFWLERMLKHFEDPTVAGVCGQQVVPHQKGINPHQWFRPRSKPSVKFVQFNDANDFNDLSPLEKRKSCSWDDVNAMYRKSILEKIPFESVMFGEDMIWAQNALLAGHKIIYDSGSRVTHYHHHSPKFTYKRTLIVWLFIYKSFGLKRELPFNFKEYFAVVYRNFKWKLHPKWIFYNWSILNSTKKAVRDFEKAIDSGNLDGIEQELALKIPQGSNTRS